MTATITILSVVIIYLYFLNRKKSKDLEDQRKSNQLIIDHKTPLETDNVVYQIEVTPEGYLLSEYQDRTPYQCFMAMGAEDTINMLKEKIK